MKYVECEHDGAGNLRIKREITEQEFRSNEHSNMKLVSALDPKDWQFVTGTLA